MIRIRKYINEVVKDYDKVIKKATSDRVALELLREKKRWLCRNDLFYLAGIVGNDKVVSRPEIFQEFCDEVSLISFNLVRLGVFGASEGMIGWRDVADESDYSKERLYLAYRAFYKTTIVTKVSTCQLLLNFPDIRIVLSHNKQENSSDNLMTIKNYFLNSELKLLFPECLPRGKDWGNLGGFSLANKKDYSRTEDSVEAIGIGTEITGRHWDVAKKNDLVTEDTVTTEEQIKKVRDWDDRFNVGHFTDQRLRIQDYEGTRYGHADLYSVKKADGKIKLIEIPVADENDNPTHPSRFTKKDIIEMKGDLGPWVYNCQMLLKPDDPGRMSFKPEMIMYYPSIPNNLIYYLLVDPANKRKKKSDYTAMLVVGVDSERRKHIIDGIRDKLDPKQRIDEALMLIRNWNVSTVGWEEVGLGDDNFYLEERRRELKMSFGIFPINTVKVAKEDRIRNILMPEYSKHEWLWAKKGVLVKYSTFHGKNYDLTQDLETEMLQFPLGQHDDLLDAMTFLKQLPVSYPEPNKDLGQVGMTYADYASLKDERESFNRRNPWERLRPSSRV